MTILSRIVTIIFCLVASCTFLKKESNMVNISSHPYQCDNGQMLHVQRWWSEPISVSQNVYGLCGGNISVPNASGTGTDSCVLVDLKTCETKFLSNTMTTQRQAVQPVCLTNGQCYLFGGNTFQVNDATKSIDVFSSQTNNVQKSSIVLPEPRLCYIATTLNDSDFLITGGYGAKDPATGKGPVYDTAILVKTATGEIQTIKMTQERGSHSITKLPNGTYLLLGGNGTDSSGGEIFDPKLNTFIPITSKMLYGRKDHRAVLASDGKVYILGGSMKGVSPTNIEVYDPKTNKFSDTALKLSEGREDGAVVYLPELNVIVLVGGEIKKETGEPESQAIDVIDLNKKRVYSAKLQMPRDEAVVVVKDISKDKKTIKLIVLTGQRKIDGTEVSLPAEEIVISM